MKVRDLSGKESSWLLTGRTVSCTNDRTARSELHISTRKLLTELYPTMTILEEVPIKLTHSDLAYLDFYIPLLKIAIEVQGEQHFKFTPFFHGTMNGFLKAKRIDNNKKEWCEINRITLLEFSFDESIDEWKDKLI